MRSPCTSFAARRLAEFNQCLLSCSFSSELSTTSSEGTSASSLAGNTAPGNCQSSPYFLFPLATGQGDLHHSKWCPFGHGGYVSVAAKLWPLLTSPIDRKRTPPPPPLRRRSLRSPPRSPRRKPNSTKSDQAPGGSRSSPPSTSVSPTWYMLLSLYWWWDGSTWVLWSGQA